MQKIMFNERYGLQKSVLEGRKTQTRREPFYSDKEVGCVLNKNGKLECYNDYNGNPIHTSRYALGEIVAIAQSYEQINLDFAQYQDMSFQSKRVAHWGNPKTMKGWKNKMFVRADLMLHHIKITYIRCERLQDISKEDCLKEGVFLSAKGYYHIGNCETKFYYAEQSFKYIIGKLNGKKFWDTNPYVIVYEFEKID